MKRLACIGSLCVVLTTLLACDQQTALCDTRPMDVIGVHVLGASEGQYTLEAGEVVVRRFAAEMQVTNPVVSARYTQAEPRTEALTLTQVDCLTGEPIADLDAGARILQFPEVACRAQCLVELCVQTENPTDAPVTVDEAVTIVFQQELSCGEVGRGEGQAPLFALDVDELE